MEREQWPRMGFARPVGTRGINYLSRLLFYRCLPTHWKGDREGVGEGPAERVNGEVGVRAGLQFT